MHTTTKQLQSLLEATNDEIANLSNMSAFIMQSFEDVSWVGFYLYKHDGLHLGPFQGKVACTYIPMGKGVCGSAATQLQTLVVEDVHSFEGHIACDCASNSEIVIPIIVNHKLYGVLDLDSVSLARFKEDDKLLLEEYVEVLTSFLTQHKK